jgi:hypothetical protein
MKTLVKSAWFIPLIFSMILGCTENGSTQSEDVIIEKISIGDDYVAAEGPWGISDGIKVIRGNQTEYFVFDIESPPSDIRDKAEVFFTYRLDISDSTIHEKKLEYTMNDNCPFYMLNTLKVFRADEKNGAYFYTALASYPYGMDPSEVVLWVYYDEQLYRFSGILSSHPDWPWDEYYSFTPDDRLKSVSPDAYNTIIDTWEEYVGHVKKRFDEYYEGI